MNERIFQPPHSSAGDRLPADAPPVLRMGDFELDFTRYELRRNGVAVAVEPRTFDLIALLARNAGRTVTRDEIYTALWPDCIVSDAALSSQIHAARKALGDDGKRQRVIVTVHGRGFRLRDGRHAPASAEAVAGTLGERAPGSAGARGAAPSQERLNTCVAVLPCAWLSDSEQGSVIAQGLTEDLINALSRNRWLCVVTRSAAFALGRSGRDLTEITAMLDADYVVTGSVRASGGRLRIAMQLTEVAQMRCIWAERFDRDLHDLFDLQDEIAGLVSARIASQLGVAEQKRVASLPPRDLGAWELYQLGSAEFYRFTAEGNRRCQELLRAAITRAPEFGEAHARLAYAMVLESTYFEGPTSREHLDEALRLAETGVALDDQEANTFFALGRVQLARGEYDLAIDALETALAYNPSHALSECALGDSLVSDGRAERAIPRFERALALSPHDPFRWAFMSYRSLAHAFLGDLDSAAHWARSATLVPNSHYWARAKLISWLALGGQIEAARGQLPKLMRARPGFTRDFARSRLFYVRDPAQLETFLNGLGRAGVP